MKGVENGKFPDFKRLELKQCTLNGSDWPKVSEFSLKSKESVDLLQMKKSCNIGIDQCIFDRIQIQKKNNQLN